MKTSEFLKKWGAIGAIDQTAAVLTETPRNIHWRGLVGSSRSISAASLAEQVPGHHLFILSDKEEAAYFLNDLEGMYPDDNRVLFYPASYRVPYQLEEPGL